MRLNYVGFGMTILEDNKPVKAFADLKRFAQDTRLLGATIELDESGAMKEGRADLTRLPKTSRDALSDISDQVLQSLEVLSVPMPGKSIRPGDYWKSRRPVLIGSLGLALPAVVDMQCTYIGTEDFAGKTLAVLRLTGTVQGLRGSGLDVGGSVRGSASIAPETGQAVVTVK